MDEEKKKRILSDAIMQQCFAGDTKGILEWANENYMETEEDITSLINEYGELIEEYAEKWEQQLNNLTIEMIKRKIKG
jgi:flagellar biosynthesis/type III secretory pathway protein FliH